MVFLKEFLKRKSILKKISRRQKGMQNFPDKIIIHSVKKVNSQKREKKINLLSYLDFLIAFLLDDTGHNTLDVHEHLGTENRLIQVILH